MEFNSRLQGLLRNELNPNQTDVMIQYRFAFGSWISYLFPFESETAPSKTVQMKQIHHKPKASTERHSHNVGTFTHTIALHTITS